MLRDSDIARSQAILALACWCRPAAAVEIRLARNLGANSTYMAPRPAPPRPVTVPAHNYSKPTHNYVSTGCVSAAGDGIRGKSALCWCG